ncbi:HAD family hydrolase [Thermoactinomyces mirandus]|uniref:HAD hydrolase-like protein n=1 Tax=Thermoactinomyces mirandus TaxID=2756294 RepID=A0A7W2AST2_9BACL|nr:HAD hydrolase-like protein [Thermoactinomyces mirandus]MBA4603005.1 HAD hydrolase-like protein [Thermoactinomyces mirandus]
MKAIIFDLDGTLLQTEKVGVPAYRETFLELKKSGEFRGEIPDDEEIRSVFGLTHEQLWDKLLPDACAGLKDKANRLMLEKELALFHKGMGQVYSQVKETLMKLHDDGWPLFIASNGVGDYANTALETEGLFFLFKGIYTSGDYNTRDKTELVQRCKEEHDITGGYMVGDRSSDIKAGKENGMFTIGCRYDGFPRFGKEDELSEADRIIHSFGDLLQLIEK